MPLVGEAGIVTAELDLDAIALRKRMFDCTGHDARADVLRLVVDRRPKPPVTAVTTVSEDLERLPD